MGNGLLDLDILFQPRQPGAAEEGISKIGSAIDAIMARREAKKKWEAEQAQVMKIQEMEDARARERTQMDRESRQEATAQREQAAAFANQAREEALNQRRDVVMGKAQDESRQLRGSVANISEGAQRAPIIAAGGSFSRAPEDPAQMVEAPQPRAPELAGIDQAAPWLGAGMSNPAEALRQRAMEQKRIAEYQQSLPEMLTNHRGESSVYNPGPTLADNADSWYGEMQGIHKEPEKQAALARTRAAYAGGAVKPHNAAELFRADLDREQREAASIRAGNRPLQQQAFNRDDKTTDNDRSLSIAADGILSKFLAREDYRDINTELRATKLMLDGLESTNVAAQKRALGIWAKQASGPGAVQQAERDEFVRSVGGMDEKYKQIANNWLNGGEVPPGQLKIFADAARNISMRRQLESVHGIRSGARSLFTEHPNPAYHEYGDYAEKIIGREFLPRSYALSEKMRNKGKKK